GLSPARTRRRRACPGALRSTPCRDSCAPASCPDRGWPRSQFFPTAGDVALTDAREAEPEARQRVGGVERGGAGEGVARALRVQFREMGEAEYRLGPRQIGIEPHRLARLSHRVADFAERQPDLR